MGLGEEFDKAVHVRANAIGDAVHSGEVTSIILRRVSPKTIDMVPLLLQAERERDGLLDRVRALEGEGKGTLQVCALYVREKCLAGLCCEGCVGHGYGVLLWLLSRHVNHLSSEASADFDIVSFVPPA